MLGRFDLGRCGDVWRGLARRSCGGGFVIVGGILIDLLMKGLGFVLRTRFDGGGLGRGGLMYRRIGRRDLWECSIVEVRFVGPNRTGGRIGIGSQRRFRYFLRPRHLVGFCRGGQLSCQRELCL
jgi:hypothetical protein